MCALDSTESCLYEAAERHEPINPHLLSVSPPLTCTTLLRPRNFDDLRLETDLSRLLSSPFLDPTVDFHRVLPWIPWGGSIVLLTSLLHLLLTPSRVFLSQGGCSGQFYSPRASKIPVSVDARSATVYKDRGFVCYRRVEPSRWWGDKMRRWRDIGRFL